MRGLSAALLRQAFHLVVALRNEQAPRSSIAGWPAEQVVQTPPERHRVPGERDLGQQSPLLPNPTAVAAGRLGREHPALEDDGTLPLLLKEQGRRDADNAAANDRH